MGVRGYRIRRRKRAPVLRSPVTGLECAEKKKRGKEREGKEEKKKGEKKKAKGTQKHTKAFWCDAKHTMQSTGEGKVQGRQAGRYIYIYVCVLPHTIFDAYICARGAGRFRIVL